MGDGKNPIPNGGERMWTLQSLPEKPNGGGGGEARRIHWWKDGVGGEIERKRREKCRHFHEFQI